MTNFPSRYTDLITSGSTNTSGWWWVGDYRLLTVSFSSVASLGGSRFTIEITNADGYQSALPTTTSSTGVSTLSGVNMIGIAPGVVTLDPPGYRWLRIVTTPIASVNSAVTITVTGTRF